MNENFLGSGQDGQTVTTVCERGVQGDGKPSRSLRGLTAPSELVRARIRRAN